MALSRIIATGDGSTVIFPVAFALGYLDPTHVTCRVGTEVDGGGDPVYRTITFITSELFSISGAAPGEDVQVTFERTVPSGELIVDYNTGDILNAVNLNIAQKHALMLVHEMLDGRIEAFFGNINMSGFQITDLGTPTGADHASTKAYVDGLIAVAQAAASASAESAATAAADAAAAVGTVEGPEGPEGPQGETGAAGTNGTNGIDGDNGLSAYEVALANGFVGTEAEWVASLVGETGATGATGETGAQGIQGIQGEPGADGADGTGTGNVVAPATAVTIGHAALFDQTNGELLASAGFAPANAATVSSHIADTANPHVVTKTQVGLGNVDNTTDAGKPVSTAQQTALNLKANLESPTFTGTVAGVTKAHVGLGNVDNTTDADKPVSTAQQTALNGKQPLATVLTNTTASFLTADETKLDGIEALADVTDATNVAAAGAIMASLLTTRGDIIYRNATVPARLAKGTEGQVLTMGADDPAWAAAAGGLAAATQAEMETGTSALVASTPGRQHFHPGHPKCWCTATPAGAITESYNMTSVTDGGTGLITFTIATNFSSAGWCPLISAESPATPGTPSFAEDSIVTWFSRAAGSVGGRSWDESNAGDSDPLSWSFAGLGDHA